MMGLMLKIEKKFINGYNSGAKVVN